MEISFKILDVDVNEGWVTLLCPNQHGIKRAMDSKFMVSGTQPVCDKCHFSPGCPGLTRNGPVLERLGVIQSS